MSIERPKTYRLSAAGQRLTLSMMAGALILWVTALWMLSNTLNIQYLRLPSSLGALLSATFNQPAPDQPYTGITTAQAVPAFLLLVLIIAVPFMFWNLCEEWATSYTVSDEGLLYRTVSGIAVLYPWHAIRGVQRDDPHSDEPVDELLVDQQGILQIRNGLLRTLHRMAFGRSRIPIYAGIEDRAELLAHIELQRHEQAAVPTQAHVEQL